MGYSCVQEAAPGVRLHYTLGGAAPPRGGCFAGTAMLPAADAMTTPNGGNELAHFALEADDAPGWMGLSFAGKLGSMWPADAVVGGADSGGGGGPGTVTDRKSVV